MDERIIQNLGVFNLILIYKKYKAIILLTPYNC